MSEPKRYFLKMSQTISGIRCDTYEHKDGEFIEYEDYARLKAEVDRLTKAGDAMALEIINAETTASAWLPKVVRDWNAAKEGKQSNG